MKPLEKIEKLAQEIQGSTKGASIPMNVLRASKRIIEICEGERAKEEREKRFRGLKPGRVQYAILRQMYDLGPVLLARVREIYGEKAKPNHEYPKTSAFIELFKVHGIIEPCQIGPDNAVRLTDKGKSLVENERQKV